MPRTARPLLALLVTLAILFAPHSVAGAASLAVHPFDSDDPILGMAVADELAASFPGLDLLIGPEVTAGAIPPVMATAGFIGLTRVIGQDPMYGLAGADVLRGALGVDVAATGRVLVLDAGYRLDLVVAGPDVTVAASLSAPHARRDRLVAQAAGVVARALGGAARLPPASPPIDGAYADYLTSLYYASNGVVDDAAALLATVPSAALPERARELSADLAAALGSHVESRAPSNSRLLRRALFALGVAAFDQEASYQAFKAVADATAAPLAQAWTAVLAAASGHDDLAVATDYLAAATAGGAYPYGAALAASLEWVKGNFQAAVAGAGDVLEQGAGRELAAALLGVSVMAQVAADPPLESAALKGLARAAPFLAYSFERLSFLAFDAGDALAAAEALAPAVQLDPESDLYWTNLGWAYYLLGFYESSQAASLKAVDLDANQYVALFNLGLVASAMGDLADAIQAYDRAIRLDPSVDDEAVKDLEGALRDHPDGVALAYSLAYLYDAEGRRDDARAQYRRFVRAAERTGAYPEFVARANDRLVVLDAPPPPLELLGEITPRLGQRGQAALPSHPGDRIFPAFEVSTPGDQLPARLSVRLTLVGEGGAEAVTGGGQVTVPSGAVGFVVDTLPLDLPNALPAGTYELRVAVSALDGTHAEGEASLPVEGAPVALRQLLSRSVVMTGLASQAPLYSAKDLANPDALTALLVAELRAGAAAADEALPTVTTGRFEGLSGGELFERSTEADVLDYLAYVIGSGTADLRYVFVDGYANWALDGAPSAP